MRYQVILQRQAETDLEDAYQYAVANAPQAALRWLDRFQTALATLSHNPQRCSLARENAKVDIELREFLFGRKPYVFRVLYMIDGESVRILRILRAQRRFLTRRQIDEAIDAGE